ncbi:polysaccharide biosynthesis tyrosine autokinase [Thalassotalea maritima]|uniref:polysaccharide biosynthesis tyrosine autokinase n=1 Tax=Thalassotalea maritima TaxID=3242416 RepID=UPI0035286509
MNQENIKSNKFQTNANDNQADEIDIARYIALLLEHKVTIIVVTLLFALAGIVFAQLQTPIYKADALVQIETKASGVPGLGDMEDLFGAESKAVTEIELLKSRKVLGDAVDELRLDIITAPKYFGKLGEFYARGYRGSDFNAPLMSGLLSDTYAWGGEKIRVAQYNVEQSLLGITLEVVAGEDNEYQVYLDGTLLLSGKVNTLARSDDGQVQLLITELNAKPGTAFELTRLHRSDAITNLLNNLQVSEKGKQSGILSLTLEGPDRRMAQKTLDAIANAFLMQNVKRMSQEVEKSIAFLNSELPKIDAKQANAEEALNQFRLQNDSVDLTLETESVLEQLVEIDTKIHELAFLEVDVAQKYTKAHPRYVSLLTKKADLEQQKDTLNASIKDLPKAQQTILRMARDVEVNQQIYLALLNKVQELNVVKASTVGNINIVDYAQVGRFPIKPKKALIVVIITLLGGLLAVAYIIIKSAFNRGVTNPQAFEDVGLTVYATVPLSETQTKFIDTIKRKAKLRGKRKTDAEDEMLLAIENPADLAIEAIRSLRTSLHFAMLEAKNNVVMISGASPGVGKSFISSNLSAVIAQAGQKVLLIDADMRKGYIHKVFGVEAENGLSDYLIGNINIDQSIRSTKQPNLDFVSRGQVPPNPSELLMSKGFADFIERASADYDLVIVDTPPILAVTDAAIIGRHAGASLMLARYDLNPLKEIVVAVNRFENNGVEIKGLIFNAVEKRESDYGYYNYGYDYK